MILLLAACRSTIGGEVHGDDGAPVAGAAVSAPGCDAVTGSDGRFSVLCEPGDRTFHVAHPDYLPAELPVHAERGKVDAGLATLVKVPVDGGRWVLQDGRFVAPAAAPLVRTASETDQKWCAQGDEATVVPAGTVRVLDNHVADWRVYALDAEGCAYRMKPGQADHWQLEARRIEPAAQEDLSPGRAWVDLPLPPGDYALVEWYEGFMVCEDVKADTWRAWRISAVRP